MHSKLLPSCIAWEALSNMALSCPPVATVRWDLGSHQWEMNCPIQGDHLPNHRRKGTVSRFLGRVLLSSVFSSVMLQTTGVGMWLDNRGTVGRVENQHQLLGQAQKAAETPREEGYKKRVLHFCLVLSHTSGSVYIIQQVQTASPWPLVCMGHTPHSSSPQKQM